MSTLGRSGLAALVLSFVACAQRPAEPPDTRPAEEAAIREAVQDWSTAAESKDAQLFASFYAPDAVLMLEGAPDMSGKGAIEQGTAAMMQDPNFALSFEADHVTVARSGDLAYETGTYTMTMSDADQGPVTTTGHYVDVWQKQDDGTWKVVVDAPVSDPGEEAAEE